MNALSQYLSLFEANRTAFESVTSPAVNELRLEAFRMLSEATLSGKDATSLEAMIAPDRGINVNRIAMPVEIAASFKCAVPHMSTLLGLIIGDSFHATTSLDRQLPDGVTFMSLARASREHPERLTQFGEIAPADKAEVALNNMMWQDGALIHIARGTKVDRPLQLVKIFSGANMPMMAFRRLLIVVEEGASLQLLSCDHTQDRGEYFSDEIVEISLADNASLELCDIEESSLTTSRYSSVWTRLGHNAKINHTTVTLSCGATRNNINVDIVNPGARSRLAGMAIVDKNMRIDNRTSINHLSEHGTSDQLFKYVLDDEARGKFEGCITVAPGAKFTEAYQTNRNILASKNARMNSNPWLEIYNDDVKCSHGASTGQLDPDALFYMEQRGIPQPEAKVMLMQAFMVDIIDAVGIDGLRDRLRHLVETRFSGADDRSCDACQSHCRQ